MQAPNLYAITDALEGLIPELVLCGLIAVLIIFNLHKSLNRLVFYATIAGLIAHLILSILHYRVVTANISEIQDVSSHALYSVFRIITGISALLTVLLSGTRQRVEYYILILSLLLGADLLLVSNNFIMILLSMELISISSYILTAGTTPDKRRAEAAWKFFIYGSAATAVMIFGMSYLFGVIGDISFHSPSQNTPLVIIGGIMMLGGFFFKMTAAPFHLWAPDVYESTPAPILAFLSVVPKLAAFLVVVRWTADSAMWTTIVAVIALFTILVGTLAALGQTNSKRMMAYSSVAQAGFLLIIPATGNLPTLIIFYSVVFAIANFIIFIVIHQQEQSGHDAAFSNFNGIGYTNPFSTIAITLALISLAGIPPVAGFMAKLFVFTAAWAKYSSAGNLIFLALFVIGLLATVASLFFYLKIPFYAFSRRSQGLETIKITPLTNLLLVILVGLLLALFLAPGLLMG